MEQEGISPPRVTKSKGYGFFYDAYLSPLAFILRNAMSYMSGANERHNLVVDVLTKGLGSGSVICNIWLPKFYTPKAQGYAMVLVLEGGGFVIGQPKDGRANNRLLADEVN